MMKLPLWTLIPALMLFQLLFFAAFKDYTAQQWITGSGAVSLVIGLFYISEVVYKKIKKENGKFI